MELNRIKFLRRLFLPLFSRFNPGDIRIRHHYTGARFHLHSFRHKSYWYHGRQREMDTMALFARLIKDGDVVIEVGAHIGYVAACLSRLVGETGHVYVFEPGRNNLPYLNKNLSDVRNVTIIPKAVANTNGQLPFFVEDVTGLNNSLISDYRFFKENTENAFLKAEYQEVMVDVVSLDAFVSERNIRPAFIKVDVEGAEREVVRGMLACLRTSKPLLMVEITGDPQEVEDLLRQSGYLMFDTMLKPMQGRHEIAGNVFCFHEEAHAHTLKDLGIQ